jgi:hypothetical protein
MTGFRAGWELLAITYPMGDLTAERISSTSSYGAKYVNLR